MRRGVTKAWKKGEPKNVVTGREGREGDIVSVLL